MRQGRQRIIYIKIDMMFKNKVAKKDLHKNRHDVQMQSRQIMIYIDRDMIFKWKVA